MYIIEMRGNNMMRVDKLICLLCISEREREIDRFGKLKYLLNIIESRRHKDVPVFIYMLFFFSFRFMQGTFCSEKTLLSSVSGIFPFSQH